MRDRTFPLPPRMQSMLAGGEGHNSVYDTKAGGGGYKLNFNPTERLLLVFPTPGRLPTLASWAF